MLRRALGLGAAGAATVLLLGGCGRVGSAFDGFGWPQEGVSREAQRMYDLWLGAVVAALAVGFFVWGLIFWCIIRYRKRGLELPGQTRFNLPIEIIYTVTPFLIISVLFYYTAIVQTDVTKVRPDPDVTVEVVAFKWNWQFNYRSGPGQDAQTVASTSGTSDTIPVLVLPTERRIRFEETSRDVIHSFFVPELLFKRDVFPGIARNVFDVRIDKEGAYVGRCAELCGTYHSMMTFELRAVSPDEYDRFMAEKRAGRTTAEALTAIGEEPLATTTRPFETKRRES